MSEKENLYSQLEFDMSETRSKYIRDSVREMLASSE